ncbi:prolipoprotein diacylglyceryl transferase [Candidatus Parcubacteria bacterium]|nr:MAG: prolipoprotein diacylglyceryl transferase [Candidatus Parcubacteria bacterium]
MNLFWQNYIPQPIIFSLGPISVRWYGLILVAAIVAAGLLIGRYLLKKSILNKDQLEDFLFYTVILSLIGARFGHVVFFNLDYYLKYPAEIIQVWNGGLSIQGGVLFGLLTVIFWAKKHKISFWRLADVIVPGLALGQAIGRWGNYFNQELFGRPVSWGIPINFANREFPYFKEEYFHPTFFYESVLNFLLFMVLYLLLKAGKLKTGLIAMIYLLSYSVIRFFMEFVRIDFTPTVWGLRMPQFISVLVVMAVLVYIFAFYLKPLPKSKK